jgi:hypothetical protein
MQQLSKGSMGKIDVIKLHSTTQGFEGLEIYNILSYEVVETILFVLSIYDIYFQVFIGLYFWFGGFHAFFDILTSNFGKNIIYK